VLSIKLSSGACAVEGEGEGGGFDEVVKQVLSTPHPVQSFRQAAVCTLPGLTSTLSSNALILTTM